MKITVVSDLHLEFGDKFDINTDADVLILSGDILVAKTLDRWDDPQDPNPDYLKSTAYAYRAFLDNITGKYKNVIWVAGNHEFYHGKFHKTIEILRKEAERYSNLHFLENNAVSIDGIVFMGATLWTNMDNADAMTMYMAKAMMNDYRQIYEDKVGRVLMPKDTVERHIKTTNWIRDLAAEWAPDLDKVVVVGHHAPTFQSIDPSYVSDELNGAYASDLSELILENPNIVLWTHGHIHAKQDYTVGGTRVYANPRGYPGQIPDWTPEVIEV